MTMDQLKTTLSNLPVGERAELAQYLLRSLDDEENKAEWLGVAEQRMTEVHAGKVVGIPADEVLKKVSEIVK